MKPSNIKSYPWSSVIGKAEAETVALNIIKILKRNGDKFRKLGFKEYKEERLKDGNYSELEKHYFNQVVDYCKSGKAAKSFAKSWNNEIQH